MAYDIELDTNGRIYLVSSSGLFEFNGKRMLPIPMEKGYKLEVWEALFKDSKNQLWTKSLKGALVQIKEGKGVPYAYNEAVKHLTNKRIEDLYYDNEGRLHLAPRGKGYFIVHPDGRIETVMDKSSGINGFVVTHLPDGTPFHFSVSQLNNSQHSLHFFSPQKELQLIQDSVFSTPAHESTLLQHDDGTYTLSAGEKHVVRFSKDQLIEVYEMPHPTLKLFQDAHATLWIGTLNGIYKAPDQNFEQMVHFAEGGPGAIVAEDRQRGLWLKSDILLFGYIPYPRPELFTFHKGEESLGTRHITTDIEKVYVALSNSQIAVIDGDSTYTLPYIAPETKSSLWSERPIKLHYDPVKKLLWVCFRQYVAIWDGQQWSTYHPKDRNLAKRGLMDITTDKNGRLYGAAGNRFFYLSDDTQYIVSPHFRSFQYSIRIHVDDEGTVWLATREGLWTYKDRVLSQPHFIPKEIQENEIF
ncbi:MAG: hypothetical protein ACFB10_19355 [Salibacteraceae bacterium]